MSIPYQPTFKLQPKTGFRYSSQPFVPPTQPINAPPPLGLDGSGAAPPPVMGAQQGPAYANDPFGGGDNQFQANYKPAAQSLGYTQGTQNPMNILRGVPVLGTAMSAMGAFDNLPDQTYGQPGTYDNSGNIFGNDGRAYNPVTGEMAQSYAKPSDWYGSWLGIGTPEGLGGSSSSYGKLRAAGEGPIQSALGSYENSVYNVPRVDRMYGLSPASKAGLETIGTRGRHNAAVMDIEGYRNQGYADDDLDRLDYTPITAEQLGYTNARPMPEGPRLGETIGYLPGIQTGDTFTSPNSYQSGVINQSGQIETPTGTIVQMNDAFGNKQSFLNDPETNKKNLQNVKASFDATKDYSGNEGDGLSDTTVSTGSGGNWNAGSDVTATSNVTGETVTSAYNQIPDELLNQSTDGSESTGGK